MIWASSAWAAVQESGVIIAKDALPSAETAYHGGGPHVFLDGHAILECDSHGGFTSSVEPPRRPGMTAIANYLATFTGELSLEPPLVRSATVIPLVVQARMAERITLLERRGMMRLFETELLTLDLRGAGMPSGVMVRESPALGSFGRTTITTLPRSRFRIEGHFDVWLELSGDGGRSWHLADTPVRMSIAQADPSRLAPATRVE